MILSKSILPKPLMLGLEGEGRRECMGLGEEQDGWDWVILFKSILPKPLMLGLEGEGRREWGGGRTGWIGDWVI